MMAMLFDVEGYWHHVARNDARARALADRHYSRQTIGAVDFMANGKTFVMVTADARAVWGVIENRDPVGAHRWRCSIFRNEGPTLSSELIREATDRTYIYWERHYGGRPSVPLRTEIDPAKTRHKRDPGRCFLKAGWHHVGWTAEGHGRGSLRVLEAP
jgi:hypothetical protein